MPRVLLLAAAIACASLVALVLSVDGPGGGPGELERSATRFESAPADEEPASVETVERSERAVPEKREAQPGAPPRYGVPRSASIRLRLVASGTDEGLFEHRVALIPAGGEPPGPPGRGHTFALTDANGDVTIAVPDARVHLEVHGRPAAPEGTVDVFARTTRLATLTPAELESRPLHLIEVPMGPQVLYRGGLPAGLEASDLRFELRARTQTFSRQPGGNGGFARGEMDDNGRVRAVFSRLTNPMLDHGFELRIWSTDGLWGLGRIETLKIENERRLFIDAPLEPRARFEVALEILDAGPEPPPAISLARGIDWTVRGGDPDREGVHQLGQTGSGTRYPEAVNGGVVRFGDLPQNASIEFEASTPGAAWSEDYELVEAPESVVASRDRTPARATLRLRRR
ncbi:MAG: hypothetical protein VXZ39_02865 [Planctomycetota bacterium]|nr:hypothetical protein [Planctomycetota bacterium]MEC8493836.1 hypothetical protein [Planctomycetota bacterium]MEC8510772.1 hypothetical protein [Planctomycetota bacterium]